MVSNAVFEDLFRDHYSKVAAFAFRLLGDRDAAEDVATDAFTVLWERTDVLEDTEHARYFVYRAARNLAATRIRNDQTRQRLIDARAVDEQPESDPSARINEQAINTIVMDTIARMPEQRRAVYTLRWEQELSYQEVAELLGISVKTVEKHVSLALAELREALAPYIKG